MLSLLARNMRQVPGWYFSTGSTKVYRISGSGNAGLAAFRVLPNTRSFVRSYLSKRSSEPLKINSPIIVLLEQQECSVRRIPLKRSKV